MFPNIGGGRGRRRSRARGGALTWNCSRPTGVRRNQRSHGYAAACSLCMTTPTPPSSPGDDPDKTPTDIPADTPTGTRDTLATTWPPVLEHRKSVLCFAPAAQGTRLPRRPADSRTVRRWRAGAHELRGAGFHDRHREEECRCVLAPARTVSRHLRARGSPRCLLPLDGAAPRAAVARMVGAAPHEALLQQPRLLSSPWIRRHRQPGSAYQRRRPQLHDQFVVLPAHHPERRRDAGRVPRRAVGNLRHARRRALCLRDRRDGAEHPHRQPPRAPPLPAVP